MDPVLEIASILQSHHQTSSSSSYGHPPIFFHVDGAWGGGCLYSKELRIESVHEGLKLANSFSFNPHKVFQLFFLVLEKM